jgi:beta-hydroxyacyl-ACP dehydratase FabZ
MLDVKQIMELIPHRFPFLLVDRVLELEEGKRIVALKNVTINEPFFQGHFPNYPVMPGVLIIEAMAQAGAVLLFQSKPEWRGNVFYFGGIEKARFRKPVLPGDSLRFEVDLTAQRSRLVKMHGRALVDGELVTETDMSAFIGEDKLPG